MKNNRDMPCFILDNCSIARKDEKGKMVCPVSDKKYTSSSFKNAYIAQNAATYPGLFRTLRR